MKKLLQVMLGLLCLCAPLYAGEPVNETDYIPPKLPNIPEKVFDASVFGAAGDGKTDNTKAIQSAIDTASAQGGGIVRIPAGEYLCGPIELNNQINLQIEKGATLKMLPLSQYPGGRSEPADFIRANKLHDIAISGEGTIDGQGADWWPHYKEEGVKRPKMIAMNGVERVLIEKVKLMNSPMFHIAIGSGNNSADITVRGVTIRAPSSKDPGVKSHNTDACDVSARHVLVENCDVSVGDDNFTCGANTSDVLIRNCTYGEGHGVSIGSHTRGELSNITVTDCTFNGTDCGIRIKSDRDRGGIVQNMTYKNLTMTNVGIPILIYTQYMAKDAQYRKLTALTAEIASTYPTAPVTNLTPTYRNIRFSNIKASAQKGSRAGLIWGLPERSIENVTLENVHITADKPFGLYNVKNVRIKDSKITTPEGENQFSTDNVEMQNGAE